ncbi:MAG: cell division protein FtsQ/DivIB [Bdellovibrio sp.]
MRNSSAYLRLFVFFSFVIGFGFLTLKAWKSNLFPIHSIELRSEQVTDQGLADSVTRNLQNELDVLRGQSLLELNVRSVEKDLRRQTWVKAYSIKKIWPCSLIVMMDFHQGKAMIKRGREFLILTDSGLILPLLNESQKRLPVLVGANFMHSESLRSQVLKFLSELPAKGAFAADQITDIRFDERAGFVLRVHGSSARIEMGKQSFNLKAARAQQVLDYLQTRQLEARVINTNLSKKVLVRLRRDP